MAGENIAVGYTTAEAAHVGWWNSSGHPVNLTQTGYREIGCGHAFNSGSSHRHYYTADFGASGTSNFFTDTLFQDVNANGKYDQAESRGSLEVTLRVNGAQMNWTQSMDLSGAPVRFYRLAVTTTP